MQLGTFLVAHGLRGGVHAHGSSLAHGGAKGPLLSAEEGVFSRHASSVRSAGFSVSGVVGRVDEEDGGDEEMDAADDVRHHLPSQQECRGIDDDADTAGEASAGKPRCRRGSRRQPTGILERQHHGGSARARVARGCGELGHGVGGVGE